MVRKKLKLVQDYRFFTNPERLRELIEKEVKSKYEEEITFTEDDRVEKELLMKGGFVEWDRRDF